jgi:predicted  nucleic acid-binding Zn-ribbon protein
VIEINNFASATVSNMIRFLYTSTYEISVNIGSLESPKEDHENDSISLYACSTATEENLENLDEDTDGLSNISETDLSSTVNSPDKSSESEFLASSSAKVHGSARSQTDNSLIYDSLHNCSSITPETNLTQFVLLQHLQVNSIADYYDLSELVKLSNTNIRCLMEHSYSPDGFHEVIETVLKSTENSEVRQTMATFAAANMRQLIKSKPFKSLQINDEFTISVYNIMVEEKEDLVRRLDEISCQMKTSQARDMLVGKNHQIKEKETEIHKLVAKIMTLTAKSRSTTEALDAKNEEARILPTENKSLSHRCHNTEQTLEANNTQTTKLIEENKKLRAELISTTTPQELAEKDRQIARLLEKIKSLKDEQSQESVRSSHKIASMDKCVTALNKYKKCRGCGWHFGCFIEQQVDGTDYLLRCESCLRRHFY